MTNLTIWTQSRIKYFEKSSYTESDEQHSDIAKDALVAAKSKISGLKVMTIDYDSTTQAKTHLTSISSSTASK